MFLTTRNDTKLYKILNYACRIDAENQFKAKLDLIILKKKKIPKFNYLYRIFFFIFSCKIFDSDYCLNFTYKNIEIGRFITAEIYKDPRCYQNIFFCKINFILGLFKAGQILATCIFYNKYKIKAIYLDHCFYLNGIFYSYFIKKKTIIYTNNFPRSIIKINTNAKKLNLNKIENIYKINNKNKIDKKKKLYIKKKLIEITRYPKKFLPWLKHTHYKRIDDNNYQDYEYLIYCHSFTDAQLMYGNDGFSNTYDWLTFTLNFLREKKAKVIIKPHPNYWNSYLLNANSFVKYDRIIFKNIISKFQNTKNFLFIKKPIFNFDLLNKLDNKKCTLVSHHGSVIFDTYSMNFKSIFSESTFWSKNFKVSNIWNSKKEYQNLLLKNWKDLKFLKKNDIYCLFDKYFFDYHSYFGKFYWQKIICKNLKMNWVEFTKKIEFNCETIIPDQQINIISKKIVKAIEDINN
jgi:hypothetical protein